MKFYAVLDTNVVVSALLKIGSVPWQVAEEALHGDIIPVLNEEILAEYEDVIPDPKDVVFYAVLMEKRKEEDVCGDTKRNARNSEGSRIN